MPSLPKFDKTDFSQPEISLSDRVLSVARGYLNETETAGNSGFYDKSFEKEMIEMGWVKGASWCAYFAELVWKRGFAGHPLLPILDKLFSGSAVATFANFSHSDKFITSGKAPKLGALCAWRHGSGWQGHIGVVSAITDSKNFKCIEGNTSAAGSREGTAVFEKTRKIGEPFKPKGLNWVGFVYLPE